MGLVGHNTNVGLIPAIKRVYYSGSSTILAGMPVCYNSDRTTDMDGNTVDAGDTNNGRWMDVENPKTANFPFFAGVVKDGGFPTGTGPAWLDIYTPNGNSIPVMGTDSFTNGEKIYLANGATTFTNVEQVGGFVGYAMDTIDRSVTEGLVLAKLLDSGSLPLTLSYGTAAGRGPSPLIWDDCPVEEYKNNPEAGMHFFDDFLDGVDVTNNQAAAAAAALGTTGAFSAATGATAGSTITSATDDVHGAIALASDTDNESAMVAWPKGATIAGKVSFVSGKKVWFETRIKINSIADTISQMFVGFAEEALNAVGSLLLINEAGVADKDYLAFVREYADGDAMNTNFNTASGGASPVSNSDAVTLEADTYTKLGIYSDGTTVTFYQDGVALGDVFLLAATDFPIGEEMAFYAENMDGAAGTNAIMTMDWVRIAQEY